MNRQTMLRQLDSPGLWDVIIVGGGATGLGCAIDAASRGYRTLLLEKQDFAQGTSSRSTKLAHGGVRYLQRGDIALVTEALRERGLMRRNAAHLVHDRRFVVPNYDWWEAPFYGVGLRVYDLLAGKLGFGPSRILSKEETIDRLPNIETDGLRGGVLYFDGQFDDARLAVDMAKTAVDQGATVLNYTGVTQLIHEHELVMGVVVRDAESGTEFELRARAVVNATGVFSDSVRRMDDPESRPIIRASQGVHIVLDAEFLPGDNAIMVPHTDDGRVLFAIPWLGKVVVGTTDTPRDEIEEEPRPLAEEIDFLLRHCARYMTRDPAPVDVRSAFAGLRPLVGGTDDGSTAAISRDHDVSLSRSGLVTVAGGKWTTYRRMAEDTINQACLVGGLSEAPCVTTDLNIHGNHRHAERFGPLARFGSDAIPLRALIDGDPALAARLHPDHEYVLGEVVWAAREEMARTVGDVLARRTRLLLLDAAGSLDAAPTVAACLAAELGRDDAWIAGQVTDYERRARGYCLT